MLVCTFTRTAAGDLVRALAELGIDGADDVFASTIHSFCFGLLSRAVVLEATGRVPRPLLNFEERFLLEDLAHDRLGGIRDLGRRMNAFNAAWARLQSDEPGWPNDPVDRAFQAALIGWLSFHEALLVGEIVPESLRYLRENPACDERQLFDHVLIDEYQDLNRAEQTLLDLLAENSTTTIVGDEDQSIYSFKHAHPEGIVDFPGSHPGTDDVPMQECRRCPRGVVILANSLISHNTQRVPRVLHPRPGNPDGEVLVVQWQSMDDEIRGIARFIHQRVEAGGLSAGSVLVRAPRRQFGYGVRDLLNGAGVPAHSFFLEEAFDGNPKDLAESQAQQTFELLTLLAEPEDRVALRCWCGFGNSSLRSPAWARPRAHCEQTGEHPFAVLGRLATGNLNLPHTNGLVERYRVLNVEIGRLPDLRGPELVNAVLPANQNWAEPSRAIAATIEGEDFNARALRDALRTGITQPELPTDVDYVRLMSLHKSKGLTAALVVVLGCIEGLIPFIDFDLPQPDRDRSLEEQRRLFYVAITRTRQTLVLSSATHLPRDLAYRMRVLVRGRGADVNTIASRFLAELGPTRPQAIPGAGIINQGA